MLTTLPHSIPKNKFNITIRSLFIEWNILTLPIITGVCPLLVDGLSQRAGSYQNGDHSVQGSHPCALHGQVCCLQQAPRTAGSAHARLLHDRRQGGENTGATGDFGANFCARFLIVLTSIYLYIQVYIYFLIFNPSNFLSTIYLVFQEHFHEVAKSRDVEVLEGKTHYLEFSGN